jgi:hypothetical protein
MLVSEFRHQFMFVRWKTRQGKRGVSLYCYLCKTTWVDGKSKSRTIAYLGSIQNEALMIPEHQAVFWMQVRENLEQHNIPLGLQTEIEQAIASQLLKK